MATLAQEFLAMHVHMARMGKWKQIDGIPRTVEWGLWKAWGPCGFNRGKYETVKKHYVEKEDLLSCLRRIISHQHDREWNSIAMPMGVGFDARPRSPLRYRDGQCMCGVVFRMDGTSKILYPQVTWRLVEITRRFLVDCAVLDGLFKIVLRHLPNWKLGLVELNLNVMWLSDYHAPLAEKWIPGLAEQGPTGRIKYFHVKPGDTKFKSRQIGNNLARSAKPMFDLKRRKLLPGYETDDFPKG